MIGPRGYHFYPFPRRALRLLERWAGRPMPWPPSQVTPACRPSLRQIARELRARRLVNENVNPATIRRALARASRRP